MSQPLRLEYVDPATLGPNPANWRVHPAEQRAAVRAAIGELGWAKPLLFNELTGRLIDGHLRRELFHGQPVPVLIGSWDAASEAKLLATLDPLSAMAEVDAQAFDALLREVDTGSPELQELLAAVADSAGLYGTMEQTLDVDLRDDQGDDDETSEVEQAPHPPASAAEVPDTVWPSTNADGIPDLDPAWQADAYDFPVTAWGTVAAGRPMRGTWLFYTADRKFERVWKNPLLVLKSGPVTCVEPNFSTHPEHPRALVAWNIYRKRWLARYWQSKGVRILVDLNVDAPFARLNLVGVPRGWNAYATRSHSEGAYLESEWELAREHSGNEKPLFLCYGGGDHARSLAAKYGWKWVPEHSDDARDDRNGKKLRRTLSRRKAKGAPDG